MVAWLSLGGRQVETGSAARGEAEPAVVPAVVGALVGDDSFDPAAANFVGHVDTESKGNFLNIDIYDR